MLVIAVCALLLAIPGAVGVMRWQGIAVILVPIFPKDKSQFGSAYTAHSKVMNAFTGLLFGGIFGLMVAFVIGSFLPKHMVAVEKTELMPIRQNGQTFYVGMSAAQATDPRGYPYQVSYYSFRKRTDSGMVLERFRTDEPTRIYEDNRSGGQLIRLETTFAEKNHVACNLFACPAGCSHYEFHIPPNTIRMF
jgi:hypothetical protein